MAVRIVLFHQFQCFFMFAQLMVDHGNTVHNPGFAEVGIIILGEQRPGKIQQFQ